MGLASDGEGFEHLALDLLDGSVLDVDHQGDVAIEATTQALVLKFFPEVRGRYQFLDIGFAAGQNFAVVVVRGHA